MNLDAKIPAGPIASKWERHKFEMKLVNPANKRKYTIVVVGTGLAGASAAASLGELGYNVLSLCIHDSPRRAHSIAAQGGINAAKNYQNDGDSVYRLFYDTVKGGDYRSREANVYRLAQLSVNIIDQCVAQGVPFAREYGGLLDNRSFGGAQVSRTFYARGQTGQQLLLGAYQSLMRQVHAGAVRIFPRREMLDVVVIDGKARGIVCRNLISGEIERHAADAVLLATGGYGTVYYLSTNAVNSNVTAASGSRGRRATRAPPSRFPRTSATTIWSASIRASATSSRAMSRRATPNRCATTATAWATAAWPCTSISRRPFSGSDRRRSKRSTEISSICTKRSRTRIRTRFQCASTRPSTTPWADCGSTTT